MIQKFLKVRNMTIKDKNKKEDWEMLGHDPVPGYRAAFYFAIVVSVIYLIFAFTSGGGTGH